MYNLPYHKDADQDVIFEFIHKHPFAFLCGSDKNGIPAVTQVPVFIDERDGKLFLTGHIMRKTDHHLAFMQNPNVLAVFTSPHVYVSATWYHGPQKASTWNYMSVHAKGTIRFTGDDELIALLKRLTLHYENYNKESSTIYDNLPESYTKPLLAAIAGFEIEITELDHIFKLSQERDEKSYQNIIDQLEQQGSDGKYIAEEMRKRKHQLFSK